MRIAYINAMISEPIGEAYKSGLERALHRADRDIALVSMDLHYGRAFSPRLMRRWLDSQNIQAVVLSGSEKNTTDRDDPWLQDYYSGLRDLLDYNDPQNWVGPPWPVLGICFGHQALGCVLGGDTARFKKRLGLIRCQVLPSAKNHPFFKGALPGSEAHCMAIHSDHVIRLPPDFVPVATSQECLIEAMAHQQWPIFSFQAHPEVDQGILRVPEEARDWSGVPESDFGKSDGPKILEAFCQYLKA